MDYLYTDRMQYICFLGRQPAIGIAELESRFGPTAITITSGDTILLELNDSVAAPNFDHFGGIQKVATLTKTLSSNNWSQIQPSLESAITRLLPPNHQGKLTLGISAYNLAVRPQKVNATALALKKIIRSKGFSVRVVPNNQDTVLSTPQVLHNKLAETGIEIVLVKQHQNTLIGRTIWVQDIDSYRRRDQERPKRDARVGMLPPKLAQIIINLARGNQHNTHKNKAPGNDSLATTPTILDPFCGTGVLLQEAALMGSTVIGTDLEPRMIEYTTANMSWLAENLGVTVNGSYIVGDATSYHWKEPFDHIACESYLGRALNTQPDPETLQKIIHSCNIIHKKFFQNVAAQTKAGFRLCIGVPAWRTKNGFRHLPVLDHLEELGYNRVSFVHASTSDLVYHRPDQQVARELVVLERI